MPASAPSSEVWSIPCNLCGGTEVEVVAQRDRDGGALRTVICRRCGLVWSDPRPIEARSYYEEEYRRDYKNVTAPTLKHICRAGRVAFDRRRRITRYLRAGQRLLDIGSGGGEFVYLMGRLGLRATGIEPNRGYANFSREEYGLDVRAGFLDDCDFSEGEFDVVTMWHALEHTEDPASIFRRVRAWLKPQGVFVVEVPNVEAVCQAPRHRFHRAHLYSFNECTLAQMGTRAGFSAEEVTLSPDGGNLTAIFRNGGGAEVSPADSANPANYRRVTSVLRAHRQLRHYLSRYPYARPFARLKNAFSESRAVRNFSRGKELLDALYSETVRDEVR